MPRSRADRAALGLGLGATVMAVCCGSQLLVASVLGGIAFGTVAGVGAGLAVFLALATTVVIRRRRSAGRQAPPVEGALTSGGVDHGDRAHG